jgi:hypothetical protein
VKIDKYMMNLTTIGMHDPMTQNMKGIDQVMYKWKAIVKHLYSNVDVAAAPLSSPIHPSPQCLKIITVIISWIILPFHLGMSSLYRILEA